MKVHEPLDDLLGGRSHVRVLRALHGLPAGLAVSGRDLARRAGVSHPTATGILEKLAAQGVVVVRRTRAADYFELNRRHVTFEPLRALLHWEEDLPRQLAAWLAGELTRCRVPATHAFIYGSAATGDMTPESDLDLAVIAPAAATDEVEAALEGVVDAVRYRYGLWLHTMVGAPPLEELQRPGRPGHRLWKRIGAEGIPLDLDDARSVAG
jgi:DNA-binding MarR family transcriptional regulator